MLGNSRPFSYSPRSFPPDEFPHSRWALQQDDYRGSSPQSSQRNVSRPTGKSIYTCVSVQRKEYSEVLTRQPDDLQTRVEHVLTCELDGQQLMSLDDCVAKVTRLDAKGRLWPQEMILEVQGGYLLLCDTETKGELEALPLRNIQQTRAVLDSCSYDALLMVTTREGGKRFPQVYIFQCEETGAELLKRDLDKFVQRGGERVPPRSDQTVPRHDNIGPRSPGGFQQAAAHAVQKERPYQPPLPPPEYPLPRWTYREPEDTPPPHLYAPKEEPMHDLGGPHASLEASEQTEADRNTDILNHVLDDLEIFLGKVLAARNGPPPQQDGRGQRKGVFKKKNTKSAAVHLPPPQEFVSCLQKLKYGFNLLGQLDGSLAKTSAPDYVHIFFTSLATILPHFHAHLPPTVVAPLLTEAALRLLRRVVSPEEDQLWRSLGDSWNIPRSRWPADVPPYIPEFYGGWQPPAPPPRRAQVAYGNDHVSRTSSQRYPARPDSWPVKEGRDLMRVMYDIVARNSRELTAMKGEVVEVLQRSKQWWLVRNDRGQDGNVPQNVLEPIRGGMPAEDMLRRASPGPASLNMASSPAEVRAWLQHRGFSKITVASLGVLTGRMLLQMGRDEMRTVCPEEGGKVFFQLQAIKSAIALASEPSGPYDGRY